MLFLFISGLGKTRVKYALVADDLFNDFLFQVKIVKEVKKRTVPEEIQEGMKKRNNRPKQSKTKKKGILKDTSNLK